ncbi:DUF1634 domain-containing protein [Candidatus Bathyarchaeota archaeon]|nr:MAG: DUF1634 domain-containing protein [Candidatus Bathyarchaeota archaeon]
MEETGVRRMELVISHLLRCGVLLSAALVILGLALTAATGDTSCPYGVITLDWILGGNPFFAPSHVLFLGFFILIATPILRIAASILMFLKVGDNVFAAITSLVMIILLLSFYLGVG